MLQEHSELLTRIVIPNAQISVFTVGLRRIRDDISFDSSSSCSPNSNSGAHHLRLPAISLEVNFEEKISRREKPKSASKGAPAGETRMFTYRKMCEICLS